MEHLNKEKVKVEVTFITGDTATGCVFLYKDERLLDLVNRLEEFIPFEVYGDVVLLAKSHIKWIEEKNNG